jgi:predicted deacylase
MIPLFVEGTMNVLKYHKILGGAMGQTSKEAGTFFRNALSTIRATDGGFIELLVDLRGKVVPGQTVAIQRNSFGHVVREYKATVTGEVATIQRDAMIEPGTRVMEIRFTSSDPKCEASGCYEPGRTIEHESGSDVSTRMRQRS